LKYRIQGQAVQYSLHVHVIALANITKGNATSCQNVSSTSVWSNHWMRWSSSLNDLYCQSVVPYVSVGKLVSQNHCALLPFSSEMDSKILT